MFIFSTICAVILAIYVGYESARGRSKYQRLKAAVAQGDRTARSRFYVEILIFECVSAALAFAALGFDPARFDPAHLQLDETAFGQWCVSAWQHVDVEAVRGLVVGALAGTAVVLALLWRARRKGPSAPASQSPLARLLPDFGALIPTTLRERLIFVIVAAVVFGLAHIYQGVLGIVVTGGLGPVFCGLYFASGTLWLPIVIHAIIDLRIAVMPSLTAPVRDASAA